MTISGQMKKSTQLSMRLMGVLIGLLFGAPSVFPLFPFFSHRPLSQGLVIAAIILGPLLFACGFGLWRWQMRNTVVEFACDGDSLQFRKAWRDSAETQAVSDVAKVWGRRSRNYGLWYRVLFRDGTQAALSCNDLPNAKVFADWLYSRSQERRAAEAGTRSLD